MAWSLLDFNLQTGLWLGQRRSLISALGGKLVLQRSLEGSFERQRGLANNSTLEKAVDV